MTRLLLWVNFRFLVRRPGRLLATLLGVAFGISMVVAVLISNRTILDSYQLALATHSGRARLQVSGPGGGALPLAVWNQLGALEEVAHAAPVVRGRAMYRTEQEAVPVLIYGVQWEVDRHVRLYHLSSGGLPTEQDQSWALVGQALADTLGLRPGDSGILHGTGGSAPVRIIGILSSEGAGAGNQGQVIFTSLNTGQIVLDKDGQLDVVDVVPTPYQSTTRLSETIRSNSELPVVFDRPADQGQGVRQILEGVQFMMWFAAVLAAFAGVVIVFTNVTANAKERRHTLSLLRTLGLSRRAAGFLTLAEAAILGMAGSALGLFLGLVLSQVVAAGLSETALAVLSLSVSTPPVAPHETILAITLGTVSTIGASIFSVREAYSTKPLDGVHDRLAQEPVPFVKHLLGVGLLLVAGATITGWLWQIGSSMERGHLLPLTGLALLVSTAAIPYLVPVLLHFGGPLVGRFLTCVFGIGGRLAGETLARLARQFSPPVAAFSVSIAFLVGFSGHSLTYTRFVEQWVARTVRWDARVSLGMEGVQAAAPLPEGTMDDLRRVPGVELVAPERFVFLDLENAKVLLAIYDMELFPLYAELRSVAGLPTTDVYSALGKEGGLALSTVAARALGVAVGEVIPLPTPQGWQEFRVVAHVDSLDPDLNQVFIDRRLYQQFWADTTVDAFVVKGDGTPVGTLVRNLQTVRPTGLKLHVETPTEFRRRLLDLLQKAFSQVQSLIAITLVAGCLSILNTMVGALVDRKQELGLLRALGANRSRVAMIIVAEAVGLGVLGAFLGGSAGILLSYVLSMLHQRYSGLMFTPVFPVMPMLAGIACGLILPPLVALVPGRQAAWVAPAEAIQEDI